MAVGEKIAKTADRKKVMDTSKSTDCPKCGKTTRIVKRMKDRERGVPGGIYISCSACEVFEKLYGRFEFRFVISTSRRKDLLPSPAFSSLHPATLSILSDRN